MHQQNETRNKQTFNAAADAVAHEADLRERSNDVLVPTGSFEKHKREADRISEEGCALCDGTGVLNTATNNTVDSGPERTCEKCGGKG